MTTDVAVLCSELDEAERAEDGIYLHNEDALMEERNSYNFKATSADTPKHFQDIKEDFEEREAEDPESSDVSSPFSSLTKGSN